MEESKKEKRSTALLIGGLIVSLLTVAELSYLLINRFSLSKNSGYNTNQNANSSSANSNNSDANNANREFTITWMNDDGTILEVDKGVKKDTTPTYDGETPTKDDNGLISYAFLKWNHDVVPATSDATFVATYTLIYNDANFVFDMNGHGDQVDSQTVAYGGYATKPADPATEGYTFIGWYKDPSFNTPWNFATDKVISNVTIYARWDINYYTVKFVSGTDDDSIEDQIIPYGGKVIDPGTPEHSSDMTFMNWSIGHKYGEIWDFEEDVVKSDLVLYASWTYSF